MASSKGIEDQAEKEIGVPRNQSINPPGLFELIKQILVYKTALIAIIIVILGAFFLIVPELFGTNDKWTPVFRILGTVFLPTGFIGFIYEYLLRISLLQLMRRQIDDALQVFPIILNDSLEARFSTLSKELYTTNRFRFAGLVDVHDVMSTDLESRFGQASRSIRILQTWIPDFVAVENQFQSAIKKGASLRILLLDPLSQHAVFRNQEVGFTSSDVVSGFINMNLADLTKFCQDHPECAKKIEVRLYDSSPVCSLYASDETYVLGLFWRGRKAIQGPQFVIEATDSYIARSIDSHFDIIWNNAREYPIFPCKSDTEIVAAKTSD